MEITKKKLTVIKIGWCPLVSKTVSKTEPYICLFNGDAVVDSCMTPGEWRDCNGVNSEKGKEMLKSMNICIVNGKVIKVTKLTAKKAVKQEPRPCVEQSEAYMKAFDWFNAACFDKELKRPMLYLTRNTNVLGGYCAMDKWRDEDGNRIHEIALNANIMDGNDVILLMRVLIHEMIHIWQHMKGTGARPGYHNQAFADKALDIGMEPKDLKTGKQIGQQVDTTLIPGGLTEGAIADMPEEAIFPWMADNVGSPEPGKTKVVVVGFDPGGKPEPEPEPKPRSGVRAKFTCVICGLNAWAKAGAKLSCVECDRILTEQV